MKLLVVKIFLLTLALNGFSQTGILKGTVQHAGKQLPSITITLLPYKLNAISDTAGNYIISHIPYGRYTLKAAGIGYEAYETQVQINSQEAYTIGIELKENPQLLDDVVITGTLKPASKSESPVPVEVYTPKYFQKNPTPNLFEAVGMINGVRPQLNCNVCNTGDIHINGMEGPYTLVLIDGMPIVSALSSVYGLSGIPNSLVERIEVVKGPAGSLYGSEAMGGIINVITKNPLKAPLLNVDVFATTWQEFNADIAAKFKAGKAESLVGLNYFNYNNRLDKNDDGFTDITQQNRISVFNKWSFNRKQLRVANIGLRYVYEDRFGGQMNWNKQWRGSDSIYGESVYTNRFEVVGVYQLPVKETIMLQYSWNLHDQNSVYGTTVYNALQKVAFAQFYWDKQIGAKHDVLFGASYRNTYYDDNTPATATPAKNKASIISMPGIFVQDEWRINNKNILLAGYRYDYDKTHGNIHSPRVAYKWSPDTYNTIRASFGTGFRVVNLFTEDHAALTGARTVEIKEALEPEKSINGNLNYVLKIPAQNFFANFDITAFYSYFSNRIIADYTTDPNKIIYANLDGHAISRGLSANSEFSFLFPLKIMAGFTYADVFQKQKDSTGKTVKQVQMFAPKWSGNYVISYTFKNYFIVDFTGSFNGPMRLPVQKNDYRPEYSPWFTLANIQLTKKFLNGMEIYGGLKNIFNFIPKYALMRSFDPFDKTANDPVTNPYGYTFDTEYNYAPLQGTRGFIGFRYSLKK